MQHPDEGTIHAWLDSALPPEEAAAVEAHVASCSQCSAAVAEARGLIAASSRIISSLDIVPGSVIPSRTPITRPWYASTQLRAAAAVLFVAGASILLLQDRDTGSTDDLARQVMSNEVPSPAMAEKAGVPQTDHQAGASLPPAAASTSAAQSTSEAKRSVERRAEAEDRGTSQAKPQAAAKAPSATPLAEVASPPGATPGAPPPPPAAMFPVTTGNAAAPRAAQATPLGDTSSRRMLNTRELRDVVVTGMAAQSQAKSESLTVISADTAMAYVAVRYRTTSGAEVLLTERSDLSGRTGALSGAAASVAPPPPPVATDSRADALPIATIEWFDPVRQRRLTLSGRVTIQVLQRIKAQIESAPSK